MTQQSDSIGKLAGDFCDLGQWIYGCYAMHLNLFHELDDQIQEQWGLPYEGFSDSLEVQCLSRLNDIGMEYMLKNRHLT